MGMQEAVQLCIKKKKKSTGSLGKSKLGGRPEISTPFRWPYNRKHPLSFLAQINFEELAVKLGSEFLPTRGMLYFFYDYIDQPWGYLPGNKRGWKVVYRESADELKIIEPPKFLEYVFPQYRINFELGDCLSDYCHQMFGIPYQIQSDLWLSCELASTGKTFDDWNRLSDEKQKIIENKCEDWILLLQLSTDELMHWHWSDEGILYFCIRLSDIKHLRFQKTWCILQSY